MRRLLLIGLLSLGVVGAGCVPESGEGGTPLPGYGSGAPLLPGGVGPSDDMDEIEE